MTSGSPTRQRVRPHVGLNAQLLSLGADYRSAGINGYIYQLLRHLPRVSDYRYTVWTGERGGTLEGIERRITPLPTRRPLVRLLWEQLVQPYALATSAPDLYHGMAFALPLLLTVPAVVTIYDLTFLHMPEAFRAPNRLYLRVMTRVSARRAARVCAISEHGRTDIARNLGVDPARIEVVTPGLDPRFAHPPSAREVEAFRARMGLPERFVLYLGTLEPRKNLPLLVRAFARLHAADPALVLVLAGGRGWDSAPLDREIERLGLGEAVLLPGYVPSEQIALWYGTASVFVYPSRYEGFGLPPLEAMACGTPVIVSRAASLGEVVGEAGITVEPDDEAALAAAIGDVLGSPERRRTMSRRGIERAARFSWTASARRQADVYRTVLEAAS